MKVQSFGSNIVQFGVKVPTEQVIDLISGMKTNETRDVFCKLTGVTQEKMLTSMNRDMIEVAQKHCAGKIAAFRLEFAKLAKIASDLEIMKHRAFQLNQEGKIYKLTNLIDEINAEKANLLKTMPESLDIPKIKLPF